MLQNPSKQQCNSIQQTANSWVSHRARPYMQRFYFFCGSEPFFFAGYWTGSCKQALGGSFLHARAFWKQNLKDQSLTHWIMPACPPPFNSCPYKQSQPKNSPDNCLKVRRSFKTSFKGPETMCLHRVISKESHKVFQTVVWNCLQPALQEQEVLKITWLFCGLPSLVSLFPGSSPVHHIPALESMKQSQKPIKDILTLPRNRKQESLNAITN